MTDAVPTIDLRPWFTGTPNERAGVAAAVDAALQRSGFILVTGHGVDPEQAAAVRAGAREFFALPDDVKRRYAAGPDGRGWLPPGVEANGYSEGTATPPDLKESLSFGADSPTGDPQVDARWFRPNPWPTEVPALVGLLQDHIATMQALAGTLMGLCAAALGLPETWFEGYTRHPTYTFNVNHYPSMAAVGEPVEGQFRIGPHTDFGTLTLLDRQQGAGGLQVFTADGEWVDAPFHPEALTINIGDLLARWTGDRWTSARHRVLPPQPQAADEDLISLIYFHECDTDAMVESMPPPIGTRHYTPVFAADYLDEKYRAITLL
jgi:isopenicillin N synthase-like dioxygenase